MTRMSERLAMSPLYNANTPPLGANPPACDELVCVDRCHMADEGQGQVITSHSICGM